jgi:hypothetical protein
MNRFHFYHKETGILHASCLVANVPPGMVELCAQKNCPPDHEIIAGEFDALSQRINPATKQAEGWQPPQPSPEHEWNEDTKRWRLNEAAVAKHEARAKALEQIAALEASQARPMRELALDSANAPARERLSEIEAQIARLR